MGMVLLPALFAFFGSIAIVLRALRRPLDASVTDVVALFIVPIVLFFHAPMCAHVFAFNFGSIEGHVSIYGFIALFALLLICTVVLARSKELSFRLVAGACALHLLVSMGIALKECMFLLGAYDAPHDLRELFRRLF